MRLKFLAGLIALIVLCVAVTHAQAPKTYKVVFDVGEGGDEYFERVIQKVANLSRDSRLAGRVEIKIVAHTNGIDFVAAAKNQRQSEAIPVLIKSGISIEACNNSMRGHNMKQEDLFQGVTVTESGVGEIVLLQQQGYAYFRP
jgi:uncharacterized protein